MDGVTWTRNPGAGRDVFLTLDDTELPSPIETRSAVPVALSGLFVLAAFYTIYLTRGLLLPIVLALLLTFLLSPIVRVLTKLHIPRMLGAAIILGVGIAVVVVGVSQLAAPASVWLQKAPNSLGAMQTKVRALKKPVEQVTKASAEIEKMTDMPDVARTTKVKVQERSLLETVMRQTPAALASIATTVILLFFMLGHGESLLRNIVRTIPAEDSRRKAVEISRQVSREVSRYLLTITMINIALGVATGVAMALMGLPNPTLWGVLAAVLNFVPYLGALTGTVVVALAAILSFDSVPWALAFPAVYYGLTAIEGTFITPMILGRSFTLHPIIVVLGLLFWTWLWGIAGTLLAVPILVTLRIFSTHIRRMEPLRAILER